MVEKSHKVEQNEDDSDDSNDLDYIASYLDDDSDEAKEISRKVFQENRWFKEEAKKVLGKEVEDLSEVIEETEKLRRKKKLKKKIVKKKSRRKATPKKDDDADTDADGEKYDKLRGILDQAGMKELKEKLAKLSLEK